VVEAEKCGLPNQANTVDAIEAMRAEKNIVLMEKHGILSRPEMESRSEISYEIYTKTINIEALTMIQMAKRQILPAVIHFKADLAASVNNILEIDGNADMEKGLFTRIGEALSSFNTNLAKLEQAVETAAGMHGDAQAQAVAYRDLVFTAMGELRKDANALETMVDAEYWPMPTYSKLLFNL
jgi:glutamine synthetase